MKNTFYLIVLSFVLFLSGCASLSSNPYPGKIERVGVLLIKECSDQAQCASYSLLEPDLYTRRVALTGDIDDSLEGYLIAVLGTDAGEQDGMELVNVERTKAITEINYEPFLKKKIAEYTQEEYGCLSLWDRRYAWHLDGRQPVLIATLNHPNSPEAGVVELEYDGLTGGILSAQSTPDIDPCQIR